MIGDLIPERFELKKKPCGFGICQPKTARVKMARTDSFHAGGSPDGDIRDFLADTCELHLKKLTEYEIKRGP